MNLKKNCYQFRVESQCKTNHLGMLVQVVYLAIVDTLFHLLSLLIAFHPLRKEADFYGPSYLYPTRRNMYKNKYMFLN